MPPQVEALPTDRLNDGDANEERPGQDARGQQRTGRCDRVVRDLERGAVDQDPPYAWVHGLGSIGLEHLGAHSKHG